MTTIAKPAITTQTAKVGDTYPREGYEIHYRAIRPGSEWRKRMGKLFPTLAEAREAVKESQKPEPWPLVQMIGPSPKVEYRIAHIKGTVTVIE